MRASEEVGRSRDHRFLFAGNGRRSGWRLTNCVILGALRHVDKLMRDLWICRILKSRFKKLIEGSCIHMPAVNLSCASVVHCRAGISVPAPNMCKRSNGFRRIRPSISTVNKSARGFVIVPAGVVSFSSGLPFALYFLPRGGDPGLRAAN